MTQLRNSFDDQTLGVLESVLDEVCRELSSGEAASQADAPAVNREQLAKLLIKHAQDGESDPVVLRGLVLKDIGRQ
jgi:hypothetical protein